MQDVVIERGSEGRVAALLAERGAERVFVVSTTRRAGADRIAAALGDRLVGQFDGATPQVPLAVAEQARERVRAANADWVVACGGGTAIGLAKAIALTDDVQVAAVPTTFAGSESTDIWGITDDGDKTTGRDARALPSLVVVDADLFETMPATIAVPSLLNAMAHSVEALWDASAAPEVHALAEHSVRNLSDALEDLAARWDAAVLGANQAGQVLRQAKMGLHHKLCHVLGGSYGTPHADTHALMLPHAMAANLVVASTARERLVRALRHPDPPARIWDLSKRHDLTLRLSQLGFTDVDGAVRKALQRQYANPRPVTADLVRRVLTDAVHGRRPSLFTRRFEVADAVVTGPRIEDARAVIVALHGRGSTPERVTERLQPVIDGHVAVVAPMASGTTWYPTGFADRDANEPDISQAIATVEAVVTAVGERVPLHKVVVVGFSQGACLALSWLATTRLRPAAVLAWTGAATPSLDTYSDLDGLPVYLSTTETDRWVPAELARTTASNLTAGGASVQLVLADSDEHTVHHADRVALATQLESMMTNEPLRYLTGFGASHQSEALPGALPTKQNTPLHVPYGLYAEQINGTGFTVRRADNHRVWLYRIRPQIPTTPWQKRASARFTGRFDDGVASPQIMRFKKIDVPDAPTTFLDGLTTFAGAGDPSQRAGMAVHLYAANADMHNTAFANIDGDLVVVPQEGRLLVSTELGWLEAGPGELLILPRGIRFSVYLPDGVGRGWVGEVFDGHLQLPERGLVGANGLADERHFRAPVAAFEDVATPYTIVAKQGGELWETQQDHSPYDVVAWHGSYAPFVYDLDHFMAYGSVTFDHPDPSVLTVLTTPKDDHGRNAIDVAVFKGRWDATEDTYRPPYLHRNSAVEFNAVVKSPAPESPFHAGAFTWTPYLTPHGISAKGARRAVDRTPEQAKTPHRLSDNELWVQFESTYPLKVMPWMLDHDARDTEYLNGFTGFDPATLP